jgi:hypothetical protein
MSNRAIDIRGIDKVLLLKEMWNNVPPARYFTIYQKSAPAFDEAGAGAAVKGYIDYYEGRCIKTDLSGDTVDPFLYDRDAGYGTLGFIVEKLRGQ